MSEKITSHPFSDIQFISERTIAPGHAKLLTPNLIHMVYTDKMLIELPHITEFNDLVEEWIGDGKSAYFLINITGKYNDFSPEAQNYLAKDAPILSNGKVTATAIVMNNLAGRILSKFFIRFYRPKYPTKIFSTETDGYNWLQKMGLIIEHE